MAAHRCTRTAVLVTFEVPPHALPSDVPRIQSVSAARKHDAQLITVHDPRDIAFHGIDAGIAGACIQDVQSMTTTIQNGPVDAFGPSIVVWAVGGNAQMPAGWKHQVVIGIKTSKGVMF